MLTPEEAQALEVNDPVAVRNAMTGEWFIARVTDVTQEHAKTSFANIERATGQTPELVPAGEMFSSTHAAAVGGLRAKRQISGLIRNRLRDNDGGSYTLEALMGVVNLLGIELPDHIWATGPGKKGPT